MHTETDFRIGIREVNPRNLDTTDDKIDLIGKHGTITGPTYARGRTIIIDGYIIAKTRSDTSKGMDWLDGLFGLQGVPGELELYEFLMTDEQSRQFSIMCKVNEGIQYDIEEDNDHNNGALRRFRISIYAPDPRFFSTAPAIESGIEGYHGGFIITNTGFPIGNSGFPLNSYGNEITVIGREGIDEPVIVTITVTGVVDSPLTIFNAKNGSFFALDITGLLGDVFVVNGKDTIVTKNGNNIISSRIPGSVRPSCNGVTPFVVYDLDGGMSLSDFDVDIEYAATIL